MAKKISIEQFDGGIQRDKRSRTVGGCSFSSHFDHTVAPNKLVPRRDFESFNDLDGVENGMSGKGLRGIAIAPQGYVRESGGNYISGNGTVLLFGQNQTTQGTVLYATSSSGTYSDQWYSGYGALMDKLETTDFYPEYGTPVGVTSAGDTYYYFPTDGLAGSEVGVYDLNHPNTLDGDIVTDAKGYQWDFCVGPDQNTYITRNGNSYSSGTNGIDMIAATITNNVFQTGSYTFIPSICRNGNYVGVGVVDVKEGASRESFVHIWDTVNDDPTAVVSLGSGRISSLAEIDGTYVALIHENTTGPDYVGALGNGNFALSLKVTDGSTSREVTRIPAATFLSQSVIGAGHLNPVKWKRADEVLMYTRVPLDTGLTVFYEGLWSIRKNSNGEFALSLAYDTTTLGAVNAWNGMSNQAYFIHGANDDVARISSTATYTITSFFETLYNPQMPTEDYFREKTLESFRIQHEPLPAGASITLKYRTNETEAWTTFGTSVEDDSISKEIVNIETTGNPLPDFKEIMFRIESLGGAVVTGYEYRYEVQSDLTNG